MRLVNDGSLCIVTLIAVLSMINIASQQVVGTNSLQTKEEFNSLKC